MPSEIMIETGINSAPPTWDEAVATAPVFYQRSFLRAFEDTPLHPVLRHAYLHAPGIAVPVTLQHGVDPMRVLAEHFPAARQRPVLLTHVWHCYETTLPGTGADTAPAAAVVRALRELGRRWEAGHFGFVNVPADSPTAAALERLGLTAVPAEAGHGLDISGFRHLDDYLATLPSKPRRNLRHDLRRAADADVVTAILPPAEADLDGFVDLARRTAAKYGNADYYRPGVFQTFVRHLDSARVIELRRGGRLIASAITLLDRRRYHFWCVGVDYDAAPGFSPFYTAFAEVMRDAIASGRPRLELGRRNPDFKRRYGMRSTPLCSYLTRT
ncbi:GNAT family N-acetyltransferase [Kitasatospora brasiliensis]|uniref:GNAT family N-acetyltransferase n=1 Tax=Kitasatospora brasiliensis TaxID=3058040 RepID=UPI00292E3BAB|nr:GNAT family N-acetyltransferase [Kitasatospora sp. K002]